MKAKIVLGSAFGDEAKGVMVDYLCKNSRSDSYQQTVPLVIRANGGMQAGHTVVYNENGISKRHIFAQFGSGTFRNAHTYYSQHCTFYPTGAVREYNALRDLGVSPTLYVDALAPLTTPYDLFYNRALENSRNNKRHGSCGLGFGTTVERHGTSCKLYVQDLKNGSVLKTKLENVKKYYEEKMRWDLDSVKENFYSNDLDAAIEFFLDNCAMCYNICGIGFVQIVNEKEFFAAVNNKFHEIIFEGAQGILIDMDFGFFPHVTRSNTTSKNALEIIKRNNLPEPEIFYMTRAYQTRHGEGPMSEKHKELLKLKENKNETNVYNDWQRNFRKCLLDIDLLNYAFECDNNFSAGLKKNLVITCLDQIDEKWYVLINGEPKEIKESKELVPHLSILPKTIYENRSESPAFMKTIHHYGGNYYA